MPVRVDAGLLDHMRLHSGGMHFVVEEASDADAAVRGIDEARRRIALIPHPEEGGPYVKYMSETDITEVGPSFWVDMADAEAYPGVLEAVLEAVVTALEDVGLEDATLSYPGGPGHRVNDALLAGLVLPQLHRALLERMERGDEPRSIASWLAAESERLDAAAYDEKP